MTTFVEASRLAWCPGLAQLEGNPKAGMQEWLSAATYAPIVSGSSLVLTGIDERYALQALAGDINKTSSAASETLRNITAVAAIPKSLGWPYVKLYYAALFYAHALLRVWGRSPSYFRTSDLLKLRQTVAAYGVVSPFKIQTSQYVCAFNASGPALELNADKGGGGTHDALWRELIARLEWLETTIANSQLLSKDILTITAMLKAAKALISNSGANFGWMSEMRNEINYRQAQGLWYPYGGKQTTAELYTALQSVINDQIDIAEPLKVTGTSLQRFRAACIFVIIFGRSTLRELDRVGGPKTFVRHGQTQFEHAIAA